MSDSVSKAGYTQISSIHTIHLLGNTSSITIRGPTNVGEDEKKLVFQTRQ